MNRSIEGEGTCFHRVGNRAGDIPGTCPSGPAQSSAGTPYGQWLTDGDKQFNVFELQLVGDVVPVPFFIS